jgi:hypothetical protein
MNTQLHTNVAACGNCRFWSTDSKTENGECRRHAPQMLVFNVDDNLKFKSHFPPTAASDWCGDYQPK